MSMNSNTSSQFFNGSFHQRYNTSLKESINTAETEINSFLSKGIMDNDTNARLRVYHVSHRLKKAGLKHHLLFLLFESLTGSLHYQLHSYAATRHNFEKPYQYRVSQVP